MEIRLGEFKFDLLGIKFSINIAEMKDFNDRPIFIKVKNIINPVKAKKANSSLKINGYKNFDYPNNHLTLTLPNPS